MLSKYVTMVKVVAELVLSKTINYQCTLISTCVTCPSHFRTCKIRRTYEIFNIMTVCIQITALRDLTTFSLVDYINTYVAGKPFLPNSEKSYESRRIFRNYRTCKQIYDVTHLKLVMCTNITLKCLGYKQ